MSDSHEKRVELILQQLEDLPTLPAIAVRVLEATVRDDSSADDVVYLLSADQSLSARILQMVHRADLGISGEVNSVERAVALLGFEAVRSAVLSITVFHAINSVPTAAIYFKREEFWKHSIAVACCAELLAEKLPSGQDPPVLPSDAFICGLLHDLGKVALDAMLPKGFSRVVEGTDLLRGNIADLERSIIGLDHLIVGKRLAERWRLPAVIRDSIWLHGQPPEALPANVSNRAIVNLISLADLLARQCHIGYSGNYTLPPREPWVKALGLTASQIEQTTKQLVARMEPRSKALGLDQATPSEVYYDALGQANKELSRMSSRLAGKNRRLAARSKFFELLSDFQSHLRPDTAAVGVLQAMGHSAADVLGNSAVAAFSLPPAVMQSQAVIVDARGELIQTTLIDCPAAPPRPAAGDGPIIAAGDELDWLLSAVSPRLCDRSRFWICLLAENQVIGGVVWGAAPGESQRLGAQAQELSALANAWALALRTAQIREESRNLNEQLTDTLRRLHSAQNEILRTKTIITVGEMAAGAAHEMNNPLAVISGRSQLLASQLTDPKLRHAANQVYEQSHRLSEIITELMDFAKPLPPSPAAVDLTDLIGRALHDAKMLDEPADRTFEVTLTDVPPVMVDESQVAAAVAELIGNAIQATDPSAGQIEIHAALEATSAQVALTISDNGCGMDEQTLKRAFDPFFSAKPAGRRRGMGLAKALRWVESSGGSIRLESRPNQGTRSLVLLPVAVPNAAAEQPATPQRKAAQ